MRSEHAYDGSGLCMLCGKTRRQGGACTGTFVRVTGGGHRVSHNRPHLTDCGRDYGHWRYLPRAAITCKRCLAKERT